MQDNNGLAREELASFSSSEILEKAIHARNTADYQFAELALNFGAHKFPDHLDSYGHPAFQKELLRSLLLQQEWNKAHTLINEPGFPKRDHWYDLLFARAYTEAGNNDLAKEWWARASQYYPAGWQEFEKWFRENGVSVPKFQLFDLDDALSADLEVARTFVRHGVRETSGTVSRLFSRSLSASKEKAAESLFNIIERAERRLRDTSDARSKIPKICHRIWLTNIDDPREPPSDYVERFLANTQSAFGTTWQHYFWVQSENSLPKTIATIRASKAKVEIKTIYKDLKQGSTVDIIERFIRDKKFSFAADVTRMKCLYEYGGIYCDMGITFNANIDKLTDKFDYIFLFWHKFFIQNGLMGMPARSALGSVYMSVIRQPDLLPRYIVGDILSGNSDLSLISGPMITTLFFLLFPDTVNACLLVPNRNLVSISAQGSWYSSSGSKAGKFGSVIASNTKPTFATDEIWKGREDVFFGTISNC